MCGRTSKMGPSFFVRHCLNIKNSGLRNAVRIKNPTSGLKPSPTSVYPALKRQPSQL